MSNNLSSDMVDAAASPPPATFTAADSAAENALDRLNKRTKDRQNYLDVKNEQRTKYGLITEGKDYFYTAFNERVHEISLRIQNVSDTAAKKANGDDDTNADIRRIFADITIEIQELERYLTKSTMFLSDYKIKICQTKLQELSAANDEARLRLIPKKKFGFRGKKAAKATSIPTSDSSNTKVNDSSDKMQAFSQIDPSAQGDKIQKDEHDAFTKENKSKTLISSYVDDAATLTHKKNEYFYFSGPKYAGKDITLTNLDNCFVEIQAHLGSLQLQNISNCILLCGPVARSCFAQYCDNTTLAVACQQLRLHSSSAIRLYLHVTCRAVIEESRKIEVAPYNYDYPSIDSDFKASGLDTTLNKYDDIADFDWLSPDIASPNWHLLQDNQSTPLNWQEQISKFKEKISLKPPK